MLELAGKLSQLERQDWTDEVTRSTLSTDEVDSLLMTVREASAISTDSAIRRKFLAFITHGGLKYPASSDEVRKLSRSSTAVLQNLEGTNEIFGMLGDGIKSEFHPKVSFSAYLSSTESHKLGMHVDKWDNIVIQLSGSKVFILESGKTDQLLPGEVLLLPQDLKHDVTTSSYSIHLSIVLLRESWMRSEGWSLY
jgi:hypothetical protein